MKQFLSSRYWLVYLGLIINLSFFISAFIPYHWYDFFFFGSSVHYCCQGMDFYQIPNGAYAFAKGGTLWGHLPPGITSYAHGFYSNYNVYHPLFTIIVGSYFFLVSPASAFYVWMGVKLLANLLVVYFLFRHYRKHKFFNLAVFIYLFFFSQYNEIRISQYQFVFNVFLLFFLHEIAQKNGSRLLTGLTYFGTIIVKPISLLWVPILLIRKKYTMLMIGLVLFILSTAPFLYFHTGDYYVYNLIRHFLHPTKANTIDVMSLVSLLHIRFAISYATLRTVKWIVLGIILLLSFSKRISLVTLIFLISVYFLFFYDLIYQYHYSILAPILTIGILTTPAFQTKIARTFACIIAMPNLFFLLRLTHVGYQFNHIYGPNPTWIGWGFVSLFQIIPISLLAIILIEQDIRIELMEFYNKWKRSKSMIRRKKNIPKHL